MKSVIKPMVTMQYFDLSHFAIVKVSGEDAHAFLNAQITCDLTELEQHDWLFSAWCLPNGRVISTFIIFCHSGAYYLLLPAMLSDKVIRRLSMYVLRSSVSISDCSDDITLLGLAGEGIASLVDDIRADKALSALRMWDSEAPRYFICCPNDTVGEVMNLLTDHCREGDRSGWSLLDIDAGMPWIINATSELYLPQMLNLDQFAGLSYRKGCYPGQEVIARLHYRGQLKKRLFLGHAEAGITPGPGDRIENAEHDYAGDVIDAERDATGRLHFLAVVDPGHADAGQLFIRGSESIPVDIAAIDYRRQ